MKLFRKKREFDEELEENDYVDIENPEYDESEYEAEDGADYEAEYYEETESDCEAQDSEEYYEATESGYETEEGAEYGAEYYEATESDYEAQDSEEYYEATESGYETEEGAEYEAEYYEAAEPDYEAQDSEEYYEAAESGYEAQSGEEYYEAAESGYEAQNGEEYYEAAESDYEAQSDEEYYEAAESGYETEDGAEYYEAAGPEYEAQDDPEYEAAEYEADIETEYEPQEVTMDTVGLEPLFMEEEEDEDERVFGFSQKASGDGSKHKKHKPSMEKQNFFVMMLDKFNGVPAVDKILASTGVLVLVLAIVTGTVYASAKAVDMQVASFYETGENLAQVGIIGESGLLAISDASIAVGNAVEEAEEAFDAEAEVEVNEEEAVELGLNMTSVEKDLKIKIVNKKTKKLVSSQPFKVEVTGPDKKTSTWEDDDKDGIIYKQNLTPGSYKVAMVKSDELSEFILPSGSESVTVKDKIVYQKIDVTDEVKTESQVNAAVEDTQQKVEETAPALKDTVEYVESTKTPVDGEGGTGSEYERVSHSDVDDPLTLNLASVRKFWKFSAAVPEQKSSEAGSSETDPSGSAESGSSGADGSSESGSEAPSATQPPSTEEPSKPDTPEPVPDQTVTGVSVKSSKGSLAKDETATVSIETHYSGGDGALPATEYGWDVSPSSAAELSGSGMEVTIKGKSVSSDTKVTVTGTEKKSGKSSSCEITVTREIPPVTGSITPDPSTIKAGETAVIKADTSDSQGVNWEGLPSGLSKESENAQELRVKADKTGSYTINAVSKSDGSKRFSCTLNVSELDVRLSFNEGSKELRIGDTLKAGDMLKVENKPSDKNLEWSSSKSDIADVGGDGVVTAKAEGETVITAKVGDVAANFTVKVIGSDLSIKLDREKSIAYTENEMTLKATVTNGASGDTFEWISEDEKKATVKAASDGLSAVITGVKEGEVKITVRVTSGSRKAEAVCKLTVNLNPKKDKTTKLKDKDGKQLYIKNDKKEYVEAFYADFYTGDKLYRKLENVTYKYTGWQTLDGKTYFFNKDGEAVKGEQIIQGAKYVFDSDGVLQKSSGTLGIDVSKWNGDINWPAVKNSGVSYVIIRCGYRGSSTGALIQDPKFKKNIQGAAAAGLRVGIYFFSQAVNEVEAVEEASMVLSLIKGYKISYPVFIDIEGSGGRGDLIDRNTRTGVANAFCQTIKNGGYTSGIYANKNWFETKMNTASLTKYKLWLAQYAPEPTYKATKYDMWQYTSKGSVSGISGNVDMNKSYLGY